MYLVDIWNFKIVDIADERGAAKVCKLNIGLIVIYNIMYTILLSNSPWGPSFYNLD